MLLVIQNEEPEDIGEAYDLNAKRKITFPRIYGIGIEIKVSLIYHLHPQFIEIGSPLLYEDSRAKGYEFLLILGYKYYGYIMNPIALVVHYHSHSRHDGTYPKRNDRFLSLDPMKQRVISYSS